MIRKVYEVDPMVCPRCGGIMKVVSFLTEPGGGDKIIDHLKLPDARPPSQWKNTPRNGLPFIDTPYLRTDLMINSAGSI
jgi:hypothetical protein